MKDLVDCNYCGTKEMRVHCGEDICPKCGKEGYLQWTYPDDHDKQEVEDL